MFLYIMEEEPDKMSGNQSAGHASSNLYSASKAPQNLQEIPSGMAGGNLSKPQDPTSSNMGHNAEDDREKTAADRRETCSLVNEPLATESTDTSHTQVQDKDQHLEKGNWTSVTEEALEMSNDVGLEQGLSCKISMACKDSYSETRGLATDRIGSVDDNSPNGHEKDELEEIKQDYQSDGTKISNRDVPLMEVNSLTDVSSVNDNVLRRGTSRTLDQLDIIGISSVVQVSAEQKEDSGITDISNVSDTSPIRSHKEEHSESLVKCTSMILSTSSDIRGNQEGTLSLTAPCSPKEHAKACEDVNPRMCVDSQTKLSEDHCSNAQNLNFSRLNTASAKSSSEYLSTSVTKLESLCKYTISSPTLKSSELFQLQAHNASESAIKCEASNLPPKQDGSLKMTLNVEHTPTNTVCSDVQSPLKEVKKQMKSNNCLHSKDIDDVCSPYLPHSKAQEESKDSTVSEKFDLPANQESENLGRSPEKEMVCSNTPKVSHSDSGENSQKVSQSPTSQTAPIIQKTARKALQSEALHGQLQKITCKSTGRTDDTSKTNLESSSSIKEGHSEHEGVCPTSNVLQRPTESRVCSNEDAKSVSASSKAKSNMKIPTKLQTNACSVPNTLKKTRKSRKRNLKKLKKNIVGFTIAQTLLHDSDVPQDIVQKPDLEDLSNPKTPTKQRCEQKGKAAKENKRKSKNKKHISRKANITTSDALQNILQPVSDIKVEPEKEAASQKQSDITVKLEHDTLPYGEFPITDCKNVPSKGHSPELVEHEEQNDRLKITKACTKKRKRSGRSFKKRKQRKITTLFSAVLETSENTNAQDLQKISQSDASRDSVTMSVKSDVGTEEFVNFSRKSSSSLVLPDLCKNSPEHEQTVLSHSVATVGTVEAGNLTSDAFKSAQKKSPGKPQRKQRNRTQSGSSEIHTDLPIKPEKRQCTKRTCLQNATASELESGVSEHKPHIQHILAKKKGKKSICKLQVQNIQSTKWSMRHCRRSLRFTVGNAKKLRKLDGAAADDTISSKGQSALSQAVHEQGPLKPQDLKQNSTRKTGKKTFNTPLPESSGVAEISHLTAAQKGKDKKTSGSSLVHLSLRSHPLNMSKENDIQVATCISSRRRKLIPDVITCDQALVAGVEPLENGSSAVTIGSPEKIQKKKCGQMRQNIKQTHLEAVCEYGGTSGVKTKSKIKRKMSEQNAGPVSKRKAASRQQATSLEQEPSTTDKLLNCLQGPFKSELPDEKYVKINADSCVGKNKVLLQTAVEEVHIALSTNITPKESKNKEITEREYKAPWDKNETKTAFELALESFIMTTQFHSGENDYVICDKKEARSEKLVMESVEAGKEHSSAPHNSKMNEKVKSLSSKKCIVCKYCGQYFRHISAYTIHQRIHTGEKPYRCKLCGKNFAQLSKLKSHRKSHTQSVSLCCPCCSKAFPNKNSFVAHFKIHLQEVENKNSLSQKVQCKLSNTTLHPSHLGKPQKDSSLNCKLGDKKFPNSFTERKCMHEDPLPCKTCGKKFKKPSHRLVHERMHRPYACSICAKGFNPLKALKKHQVSNQCREKGELNGDNRDREGFLVTQGVDGQVNTPVFFKCKICRQLFQKWCQYTLHLQTHTRFPPHLCFACGQRYEKVSEVSVHCKVCCQSSGEEAACGASLSKIFDGSDVQNYSSSWNSSHLGPCSLQTSKNKSIPLSDGAKSNKNSPNPSSNHNAVRTENLSLQTSEVMHALSSSLHEMVHLPKDSGQLPSAINHLNSAPPSPTPSVITCVSSNDILECTEISPSLWRFECSRCGRRFKGYRSLCAHMQTHAPNFRHVCGHCGQTFKRWNRLWLHQRIHGGKVRCYSCSQCSLQFRFFGSYKDHMLNHAGERPFACPLCPETFVREEGLHVHQCTFHKPSKILQCEVCAKTFSTLQNLLKHSLLHKGAVSHQCLSCKLSFTNNKILKEHLKMHNNSPGLPLPDIPSEPLAFSHKCKRCEASFSTGDLLYAHQTCHFRSQAVSIHVNEPPSSTLREKPQTETTLLPSTTRPPTSTLNLDSIPNDKSLYTYPHPDKLYTMPSLSRIRLPIINLDSDNDEEEEVIPLPVSTASPQALPNSSTTVSGHPLQRMPESTQASDTAHLPQGLKSPKSTPVLSQPDDCMPADCTKTSNVQENSVPNSKTQTSNFVETDVVIEDPATFSNSKEHEELDESFECLECSYKTRSLLGLYEHYFVRALANGCLPP
ncbi:hypothetical protein AMEX_G4971 [Astyanax mexicanus]|uniref:C2H2-type domain-containing protein n=1 Tax=Astyanax mexicanus TaxID=7994 RepID=A0A8B9KE09_ASTMX|nr:hypothetical protein AMEX_G4971 [Astyanax mexicanus]